MHVHVYTIIDDADKWRGRNGNIRCYSMEWKKQLQQSQRPTYSKLKTQLTSLNAAERTSQLQVSAHHRCKWAHITGVSGHYLLQSCHSDFQPSVFCYCSPYSWTFTGPMKTFTKNTIDASMLSGMQCEWTLFTTQNTSQDQEQSVLLPTQWPVASMSGK